MTDNPMLLTDIPAHIVLIKYAVRELEYKMLNAGFNMKKTFLLLIPKSQEEKFTPMVELGNNKLNVITVFDEFALDIFLLARSYESSRPVMKMIGYDDDGDELYEPTGEHEAYEEPLIEMQYIGASLSPKLACRTPQFITRIEIKK